MFGLFLDALCFVGIVLCLAAVALILQAVWDAFKK